MTERELLLPMNLPDMTVNPQRRIVVIGERVVSVGSNQQWAVLELFMRSPDGISMDDMNSAIRKAGSQVLTVSGYSVLRRLRLAIEPVPDEPVIIVRTGSRNNFGQSSKYRYYLRANVVLTDEKIGADLPGAAIQKAGVKVDHRKTEHPQESPEFTDIERYVLGWLLTDPPHQPTLEQYGIMIRKDERGRRISGILQSIRGRLSQADLFSLYVQYSQTGISPSLARNLIAFAEVKNRNLFLNRQPEEVVWLLGPINGLKESEVKSLVAKWQNPQVK